MLTPSQALHAHPIPGTEWQWNLPPPSARLGMSTLSRYLSLPSFPRYSPSPLVFHPIPGMIACYFRLNNRESDPPLPCTDIQAQRKSNQDGLELQKLHADMLKIDMYFVLTPSLILHPDPIRSAPCSPHPRYSMLTPSQVLRAHPILGTPCSPHPRYSMLTPSQVLHAHPINGTPCSPNPKCFTPSQVLHAHPISGTPRSPHPRYSVLTHPRYSVLTPSQVHRAHPISGTLFSPHLRYSVLTPSQVLHAHPISGTPCSPHLRCSVLTPS